jgi:nucleoside-diphosphate-sugar epimerase
MDKILIIGGAGYIGGYLTDFIAESPYIKNYNRLKTAVLDHLIYEDRFLKQVDFFNIDIRDVKELEKIIHNYKVVVLLAALVGDPACAVDKQLSYDINVTPVKWIADNYNGKIVFTSTCSVYGKNDDLIDETATPNPLSVYAETKLEAEQYLYLVRPDSLIFRLGTLYGLGDTHSRLRLDLVVNVLTLKATLGETLRVFGGEQWRPLLHVKDVSTATMFGIENNLSGIYNLSEKNCTMKDMAETIVQEIPSAKVEYSDIPFEDRRNYKVKNNKIMQTGWRPHHNLVGGIREMYNVFSEKRIKKIQDDVYHNGNYIKKLYGKS